MNLYCTRPGCHRPVNLFPDLDDPATLKAVPQKYCTSCGMGLILAGRYLPLSLLGQGGFGAAFLSRDRYTPGFRKCVVKQFLPSGNLTPGQLQVAQELFEREAEVLEELGNAHPLIPDLFAFFELTAAHPQTGKQDKFFYLVQEFIDGQTMEEELSNQGPLPVSYVTEMLEEILKVLAFVHDHGSIHRDIKPSNIMRHRNGHFYLLDFGAVRQATKGGASRSTGIYSLGFAPPEQVSGSEVYPCSDLYALAVTCIMLLTGKQPNELFDAYSNTWKWEHYVPVSGHLVNTLNRMLSAAVNQRFASAPEVLQALKQGGVPAASPPAPAPPPGPAPAPVAAKTTLPSGPGTGSGSIPAPVPTRPRSQVTPFSIPELLGGAAFTGFEGGLLLFPALAIGSLMGTVLLGSGLWLLLVAGLVFAQSRRFIERMDLLIIVGLTLLLLFFLPASWRLGNPFLTIVVLGGLGAALAVAVTACFRLIYRLLSRIL